jgi:hypothetical protein
MGSVFSSSSSTSPGVAILAPPVKRDEGGGWGAAVFSVLGGVLLLYLGYVFYNYIQRWNGQPGLPGLPNPFATGTAGSGDKTPAPVDGKTRTIIPSGDAPSTGGADWGLQYWMYISDWNYKFGSDKDVVKRIAPNNPNITGPRIFLSPSDNTLNVQVSVFPTDESAGAANPTSSSTGDSFTCSVENVPLQSWFAVSVTCFQRNLDIYINGRLVKSCVLPGVPKPAVGDIILNDNGGFSGSTCNLNWFNSMLSPDNAKGFHAKGTQCAPPAAAGAAPVDPDSVFITLFGYTFRFSKIAKDGKELSSYTF